MCCKYNFFVYHHNLIKLGDVVVLHVCVLQLHKVSLNSDEEQKKVLYTFNDPTVRQLAIGELGLMVMLSRM